MGIIVALNGNMLEIQILLGAVGTLVSAVLIRRRFRSRSISLAVPPVTEGWLADRRRVREDLTGWDGGW